MIAMFILRVSETFINVICLHYAISSHLADERLILSSYELSSYYASQGIVKLIVCVDIFMYFRIPRHLGICYFGQFLENFGIQMQVLYFCMSYFVFC